jgi:hypothetical protein
VAANPNFLTDLLTTTVNKHRKRFTDVIFKQQILTWYLQEENRVAFEDGGNKIIEPLVIAENSTVATYSDYDPINITPQQVTSAAEYEWRQLAGSVTISGIEKAKNSGETALLKIVEARVETAEKTMSKKLNTMLWGSGAGKDWNGIGNLIDSTGTVGNINGGTEAYWRSFTNGAAGVDRALTEALLRTAYNSASDGNEHPDLGVTTQVLFEKFESLLTPNLRYTDTKLAQMGFENLRFKQSAVTYDAVAPIETFYFLNSKYLKLVGHKDVWFVNSPFVDLLGTTTFVDATASLIRAYGNLVTNDRSKHAKVYDLIP